MAEGNFIAYYRVSTERQGRSGLGLEAQRAAVESFLDGGNWRLVADFTEKESGRKASRPELTKALAACRVRGATLVIAKLDRLTRDTKFLLNLVDSGADILFCDLPQVPAGAMGRFMLTQMAAVAELEAGLISKRTKDALAIAKQRRAERGERPLGGFRGYKPTETDRASALAVRQQKARQRAQDIAPILDEIRAGGITSLTGIAKALNERSIPTPRGGKEWSAIQVKRLTA